MYRSYKINKGTDIFKHYSEITLTCGNIKETTYQIRHQPFLVFAFYSRLLFNQRGVVNFRPFWHQLTLVAAGPGGSQQRHPHPTKALGPWRSGGAPVSRPLAVGTKEFKERKRDGHRQARRRVWAGGSTQNKVPRSFYYVKK